MRQKGTKDWPNIVPSVINNWNNRQHKSLGGLRPVNLNSKEKSVLLDQYVNKPSTTFEQRRQNEEEYKREGDIQVDSYVFVSPNIKRQRGFDEQVSKTRFKMRLSSRVGRTEIHFSLIRGQTKSRFSFRAHRKKYLHFLAKNESSCRYLFHSFLTVLQLVFVSVFLHLLFSLSLIARSSV